MVNLVIYFLSILLILMPLSSAHAVQGEGTPFTIKNMPDILLCVTYGDKAPPENTTLADVKNEMVERNLLTPEEWEAVETKEIKVGMSLCSLWAAWSNNTKPVSRSSRNTLEYECRPGRPAIPYCPSTTVIVENRTIMSIVRDSK